MLAHELTEALPTLRAEQEAEAAAAAAAGGAASSSSGSTTSGGSGAGGAEGRCAGGRYVGHALAVCRAVMACEFPAFLGLYAGAPRMAPYLMDLLLPQMRAKAYSE